MREEYLKQLKFGCSFKCGCFCARSFSLLSQEDLLKFSECLEKFGDLFKCGNGKLFNFSEATHTLPNVNRGEIFFQDDPGDPIYEYLCFFLEVVSFLNNKKRGNSKYSGLKSVDSVGSYNDKEKHHKILNSYLKDDVDCKNQFKGTIDSKNKRYIRSPVKNKTPIHKCRQDSSESPPLCVMTVRGHPGYENFRTDAAEAEIPTQNHHKDKKTVHNNIKDENDTKNLVSYQSNCKIHSTHAMKCEDANNIVNLLSVSDDLEHQNNITQISSAISTYERPQYSICLKSSDPRHRCSENSSNQTDSLNITQNASLSDKKDMDVDKLKTNDSVKICVNYSSDSSKFHIKNALNDSKTTLYSFSGDKKCRQNSAETIPAGLSFSRFQCDNNQKIVEQDSNDISHANLKNMPCSKKYECQYSEEINILKGPNSHEKISGNPSLKSLAHSKYIQNSKYSQNDCCNRFSLENHNPNYSCRVAKKDMNHALHLGHYNIEKSIPSSSKIHQLSGTGDLIKNPQPYHHKENTSNRNRLNDMLLYSDSKVKPNLACSFNSKNFFTSTTHKLCPKHHRCNSNNQYVCNSNKLNSDNHVSKVLSPLEDRENLIKDPIPNICATNSLDLHSNKSNEKFKKYRAIGCTLSIKSRSTSQIELCNSYRELSTNKRCRFTHQKRASAVSSPLENGPRLHNKNNSQAFVCTKSQSSSIRSGSYLYSTDHLNDLLKKLCRDDCVYEDGFKEKFKNSKTKNLFKTGSTVDSVTKYNMKYTKEGLRESVSPLIIRHNSEPKHDGFISSLLTFKSTDEDPTVFKKKHSADIISKSNNIITNTTQSDDIRFSSTNINTSSYHPICSGKDFLTSREVVKFSSKINSSKISILSISDLKDSKNGCDIHQPNYLSPDARKNENKDPKGYDTEQTICNSTGYDSGRSHLEVSSDFGHLFRAKKSSSSDAKTDFENNKPRFNNETSLDKNPTILLSKNPGVICKEQAIDTLKNNKIFSKASTDDSSFGAIEFFNRESRVLISSNDLSNNIHGEKTLNSLDIAHKKINSQSCHISGKIVDFKVCAARGGPSHDDFDGKDEVKLPFDSWLDETSPCPPCIVARTPIPGVISGISHRWCKLFRSKPSGNLSLAVSGCIFRALLRLTDKFREANLALIVLRCVRIIPAYFKLSNSDALRLSRCLSIVCTEHGRFLRMPARFRGSFECLLSDKFTIRDLSHIGPAFSKLVSVYMSGLFSSASVSRALLSVLVALHGLGLRTGVFRPGCLIVHYVDRNKHSLDTLSMSSRRRRVPSVSTNIENREDCSAEEDNVPQNLSSRSNENTVNNEFEPHSSENETTNQNSIVNNRNFPTSSPSSEKRQENHNQHPTDTKICLNTTNNEDLGIKSDQTGPQNSTAENIRSFCRNINRLDPRLTIETSSDSSFEETNKLSGKDSSENANEDTLRQVSNSLNANLTASTSLETAQHQNPNRIHIEPNSNETNIVDTTNISSALTDFQSNRCSATNTLIVPHTINNDIFARDILYSLNNRNRAENIFGSMNTVNNSETNRFLNMRQHRRRIINNNENISLNNAQNPFCADSSETIVAERNRNGSDHRIGQELSTNNYENYEQHTFMNTQNGQVENLSPNEIIIPNIAYHTTEDNALRNSNLNYLNSENNDPVTFSSYISTDIHRIATPNRSLDLTNHETSNITVSESIIRSRQGTQTQTEPRPNSSFGYFRDTLFKGFEAVLPLTAKAQVLRERHAATMKTALQDTFFGALFSGPASPFLSVSAARGSLTRVMSKALRSRAPRRQLRVALQGEDGVDAGGLRAEAFSLLASALAADGRLFKAAGGWLWLQTGAGTRCCGDLGRFLAAALFNDVILPIPLHPCIFKLLLGVPPSLVDLAAFDPSLASSLTALLEISPSDLLDLQLPGLAVYEPIKGKIFTSKVGQTLSASNVEDFVLAYVDLVLHKAVLKQIIALKEAFDSIVPLSSLHFLHPEELSAIIIGEQKIDCDYLMKNTAYSGYKSTDKTIKNFWEIFKIYTQSQRRRLIRFITGCNNLPVQNERRPIITIVKNGCDTNRLPSSQTCFRTFLLPEYSTKEKMEEKISKAITMTSGFYLL